MALVSTNALCDNRDVKATCGWVLGFFVLQKHTVWCLDQADFVLQTQDFDLPLGWRDADRTDGGEEAGESTFGRKEIDFGSADNILEHPETDLETLWQGGKPDGRQPEGEGMNVCMGMVMENNFKGVKPLAHGYVEGGIFFFASDAQNETLRLRKRHFFA